MTMTTALRWTSAGFLWLAIASLCLPLSLPHILTVVFSAIALAFLAAPSQDSTP